MVTATKTGVQYEVTNDELLEMLLSALRIKKGTSKKGNRYTTWGPSYNQAFDKSIIKVLEVKGVKVRDYDKDEE